MVRSADAAGTLDDDYWTSTGGWNWVGLGDSLAPNTGPAVTSRQSGYLDVAYTGNDHQLHIKSYQPSGWVPTYAISSTITGGPGIAAYPGQGSNGREDYVAQVANGPLDLETYTGSSFSQWSAYPGGQTAAGNSAAPIWWQDTPGGPERFDIFTYAIGNSVSQRTWTTSGWADWTTPGGDAYPAGYLPVGSACRSGNLHSGAFVGIALGRSPQALISPQPGAQSTIANAYADEVSCLTAVNGNTPPPLRVQIPIDAVRTPDGPGQIAAFAQLLSNLGGSRVTAVVSIMSHDFTKCTNPVPAAPAFPTPLQSCQYPANATYTTMFREVEQAVVNATGRAGLDNLYFSTWNEPDNAAFTLGALSSVSAAQQAGIYYNDASTVIPTSHLLGGQFNTGDAGTQSTLVNAFQQYSGASVHPWVMDDYQDMTVNNRSTMSISSEFPNAAGFQSLVNAPAVWLTETGAQLNHGAIAGSDGTTSLSGHADLQFGYGQQLLNRLQTTGTGAFLYGITPDGADPANWDTGVADLSGRARPVLCGLGQIAAYTSACAGSSLANH